MFLLLDYFCPDCSRTTEHFADRKAPEPLIDCGCGGKASRAMPAPRIKGAVWSVERGPSAPRPPHILDTRPDED